MHIRVTIAVASLALSACVLLRGTPNRPTGPPAELRGDIVLEVRNETSAEINVFQLFPPAKSVGEWGPNWIGTKDKIPPGDTKSFRIKPGRYQGYTASIGFTLQGDLTPSLFDRPTVIRILEAVPRYGYKAPPGYDVRVVRMDRGGTAAPMSPEDAAARQAAQEAEDRRVECNQRCMNDWYACGGSPQACENEKEACSRRCEDM